MRPSSRPTKSAWGGIARCRKSANLLLGNVPTNRRRGQMKNFLGALMLSIALAGTSYGGLLDQMLGCGCGCGCEPSCCCCEKSCCAEQSCCCESNCCDCCSSSCCGGGCCILDRLCGAFSCNSCGCCE